MIGGGPAGVAAAVTLIDAGHRPVLVERSEFPRPHIGESLVPEAMRELKALGLFDALQREGFVEKPGARFVDRAEGLDVYLGFSEQAELPMPWQVERDIFDAILLREAQSRGAELIKASVRGAELFDDHVVVSLGDERPPISARYVIDASGQRALLASQLGLRKRVRGVSTHAYSAYVGGLPRPDGGSIQIHFCEGGWLWSIPLRDDVTSVGVVLESNGQRPERLPAEIFAQTAAPLLGTTAGELEQRFEKVHAHAAINSCCSAYSKGRVVLAGDAAGFIDPVFSTGVYVALWSGRRAANAVVSALASGSAQKPMAAYSQKLGLLHGVAYELIRMFYGGRFTRLLSTLGRRPEVEDEVVALLSGDFLSGHGAIGQALLRRAEKETSIAE